MKAPIASSQLMSLINVLDRSFNLRLSRKIFLTAAAISLLFIFFDFLYLGFLHSPKISQISEEAVPIRSNQAREGFESYSKIFNQNTIFGAANSNAGPAIIKIPISERVKDYRLKGVILSNDPEAILEDARTGKNNFLKVGEQIGELKVKTIGEGKIVLSCGDEEIKLEIQ